MEWKNSECIVLMRVYVSKCRSKTERSFIDGTDHVTVPVAALAVALAAYTMDIRTPAILTCNLNPEEIVDRRGQNAAGEYYLTPPDFVGR